MLFPGCDLGGLEVDLERRSTPSERTTRRTNLPSQENPLPQQRWSRLTRLLRATLAHYSTRNVTSPTEDLLQPRSNQLRLLTRYGSIFRPGFNAVLALSWNIKRDFLQNTVVQASYNWDCCGVAFEFRRLGLGPIRSANEYRFSFTVANAGTFGTITSERRLF